MTRAKGLRETGEKTYSDTVCDDKDVFAHFPTVCHEDITVEVDVGHLRQ